MDQIFRCLILVVSLMLPSLLHSESFGRHVSIENIEVNLPSRNTKIDVSSSLLDILQKQQINYKLN